MQFHLATLSALVAGALSTAGFVVDPADKKAPTWTAERSAAVSDASGLRECRNTVRMEPVAIMTSAGSTLSGPVTNSTMVYSNGTVIMTTYGGLTGGSSVVRKRVPRSTVTNLQADLLSLGALRQCDDQRRVPDLPMTTVTVFGRGASSVSHTYSYWIPRGDARLIEDRVVEFVAAQVLTD